MSIANVSCLTRIVLTGLLLPALQGCSSKESFGYDASVKGASVALGGGTLTSPPPPPLISPLVAPMFDPTHTVCDPFAAPSSLAASCTAQSFVGRLFVQPRSALVPGHNCSATVFPVGATNVDDYVGQAGWDSGLTIAMSQLNVPPQPFTNGFQTSSGKLLTVPGTNQPLIEWFGLELEGRFRLHLGEAPGQYQIAVISDDGSKVEYDPTDSGAYRPLIDDQTPSIGIQTATGCLPGGQSARMGCSKVFNDTSTITTLDMTSTNVIPLRVRWYQGPRTQLALMLMYRKVPAAGVGDVNCESTVSGLPNLLPTMNMNGWQIITSANLDTVMP